jgi:UDP-N-acetylglucosamine acyltransferase
MSASVHPTAIVHPKAELDAGVSVGPYCVIGAGVRVGRGTVLHNHVTLQGPLTLGADNVVYPFAVLGAEPQDLKYKGGPTEVVIGDRNKFREHATVHRGTEMGGGRTVIGSDCLIMVGVHVAHDCSIEDQVVIANGCMLGGHCRIERGAGIGGAAALHHFTTVGTLAFVGGLSRINKDVPPYTVVEGSPAEVRKLNTTALMRQKWTEADIERMKAAFKLIFRAAEVPAREAVARLRGEAGQTAAVLRLCDFVERVEIGVYGRQLEAVRADRNA